jgi:hypothetical protein
LADEEENRLIYVEITFCNYFSEIDYEKIINKKHLPVGFDAKQGNPTRKNMMKKPAYTNQHLSWNLYYLYK